METCYAFCYAVRKGRFFGLTLLKKGYKAEKRLVNLLRRTKSVTRTAEIIIGSSTYKGVLKFWARQLKRKQKGV